MSGEHIYRAPRSDHYRSSLSRTISAPGTLHRPQDRRQGDARATISMRMWLAEDEVPRWRHLQAVRLWHLRILKRCVCDMCSLFHRFAKERAL